MVDRTARLRPALGGISIGHFKVTAGTFGCLVYRKGERFILSNCHVLANPGDCKIGDSIIQPGVYDGGKEKTDEIAKLYDFVPLKMEDLSDCSFGNSVTGVFNFFAKLFRGETRLVPVATPEPNLVDCAIAKPCRDEDVSPEILEIGIITGEAEPEVGMAVKKSGRSSGLTPGTIRQVNVTANINMGDGRMAIFTDQFSMGPMSAPGDSGSAIVTEDNRIVGLLFAGSDTITLGCKFSNIKKLLKLDGASIISPASIKAKRRFGWGTGGA